MDFERFTDRARGFVEAARTLARARDHQTLTALHLLHALLADRQGLAAGLMRVAGADPEGAFAATEEAPGAPAPDQRNRSGPSLRVAGVREARRLGR